MPISLRLKLPFTSSPSYSPLPTSSPPHYSRRHSLSQPSSKSHHRHKHYNRLAILSLGLSILGLVMFLNQHASDFVSDVNLDKAKGDGWLGKIGILPKSDHCKRWDPELPEEMDPVACLRARQYRQTMRVLEREMEAKHEHWYFTLDHNRQTLRELSRCFLPTSHVNYTQCPEKPLVVSGWWYTAEVVTGATTGEVIWQSSVVKQVEELGYFWIAVGPYVNWVEVAELMPDVYQQIWVPDVDAVSCITDPRCIAKDHYTPPVDAQDLSVGVPDRERGVIKIWQIMTMDYWGARPKTIANSDVYFGPNTHEGWSFQPLGQEWIATPWPLPGGHFHLAYTIEDVCMKLPVKPFEDRDDSVLLLMKRTDYFSWPEITPPEHFTYLAQDAPFNLLSTALIQDGHPLPEGFESLGPQTRDGYEKLVGEVKVMVGMGNPMTSPSVYTALCQGTPVVIPYLQEDTNLEGWNAYGRFSQHGPAALIGPPYVYSYHRKNYTSLVEAMMKAYTTPIERFITPEMTHSFALSQTRKLLEMDFESLFRAKVAANGGEIPRLIAGAREKCFELERCRGMLPRGVIKWPTLRD